MFLKEHAHSLCLVLVVAILGAAGDFVIDIRGFD